MSDFLSSPRKSQAAKTAREKSTLIRLGSALAGAALAAAAAACASRATGPDSARRSPEPAGATVESERPKLTRAEARARAEAVRHPEYRLSLKLSADKPSFEGEAVARFELTRVPADLRFEFRGGRVRSLQVNGAAIEGARTEKGTVRLPADKLRIGANETRIVYEQDYARTGHGLHRFQDPEDGRVYLYTQFEPFDANHLFPCFDQPDLKATYQLTATVPSEWTSISTERESNVIRGGDGPGATATWTFPKTPRLSTYVFSFHAGPYAQWTSWSPGLPPMRLFARQSLKKYVKPEEWFSTTRKGLRFFSDYFGVPYPFTKYDQIAVPEFNSGAMENAGAVTFNERFVSRGKPSRAERASHASVILHEMAHMWFGDLVTMDWWDGLWLNESFATYMAALAASRATEHRDAFLDFHFWEKQGALRADQLVTTHPVHADVPDVDSAFVQFDAITYGKGASAIKQLAFYVGPEGFRKGLKAYFEKHAFGTASLDDFTGAIEAAAGRKLGDWSKRWLTESGADQATPAFACKDGRIASFEIAAKPPAGQLAIRPHRTRVGLFELRGETLALYKAASVDYASASTPVPSLVGAKCPDFVHPNLDDHDYAKARLDPASLKAAKRRLASIHDDLARLTVWPILEDMMRDGELPAPEYVEIALAQIPKERSIEVLEGVWGSLDQRGALRYFAVATEEQRAFRAKAARKLEDLAWSELLRAKPGSDWQAAWFRAFTLVAESEKAQGALEAILAGRQIVKGLDLDPDRRWAAAIRLSALGAPNARAILDEERRRDSSDAGQRYALAAEAASPDAQSKDASWKRALDSGDLTLARRRAIFANLFPIWQEDWRARYLPKFLDELGRRAATSPPEFLESMMRGTPAACSPETQTALDGFLSERGDRLSPTVKKPFLIARQENERCVRLRGLSARLAPPRAEADSSERP